MNKKCFQKTLKRIKKLKNIKVKNVNVKSK